MKIAYIYPGDRKEIFGIAQQALPTSIFWGAAELQEMGHSVLHLSAAGASPLPWRIAGRVAKQFLGMSPSLHQIWRERSQLRNVDVVFFISPNAALAFALLSPLLRLRARTVFHAVGHQFLVGRAAAAVWSRLDAITTFCRLETKELQQRLAGRGCKIVTLNQGIDIDYYQPEKTPSLDEQPFILGVGADRYRDVTAFCGIAKRAGGRFVYVGSESLFRGVDPPDNVEFITKSPMQDTRRLIQTCRALLMTTRPCTYFSGFTTMLATMACSRPVIYDNALKGASYDLRDGETVLEYPRGDLDAGAAKVMALQADAAAADRIGRNARRHVEQFSAGNYARSLHDLFARLTASARRGGELHA